MKGWKVLLVVASIIVQIGTILAVPQASSEVSGVCDLAVGNLHAATNDGGLIPAGFSTASVGEPITPGTRLFEATVVNYGPDDCSGFRAYWYIDGEEAKVKTYGGLPAGEDTEISALLSTTPGRHEVRVYVEPIYDTDPNMANNIDEGYFWF